MLINITQYHFEIKKKFFLRIYMGRNQILRDTKLVNRRLIATDYHQRMRRTNEKIVAIKRRVEKKKYQRKMLNDYCSVLSWMPAGVQFWKTCLRIIFFFFSFRSHEWLIWMSLMRRRQDNNIARFHMPINRFNCVWSIIFSKTLFN